MAHHTSLQSWSTSPAPREQKSFSYYCSHKSQSVKTMLYAYTVSASDTIHSLVYYIHTTHERHACIYYAFGHSDVCKLHANRLFYSPLENTTITQYFPVIGKVRTVLLQNTLPNTNSISPTLRFIIALYGIALYSLA